MVVWTHWSRLKPDTILVPGVINRLQWWAQGWLDTAFFSPFFQGNVLPEQATWLEQLKQTCEKFRFDHITEHFGFMTARTPHGDHLYVSLHSHYLNIGRTGEKGSWSMWLPCWAWNLAFSYSLRWSKRHGAFLEQLLEPVNGFIILDLTISTPPDP